jgi:hypothetical protein
VKRVGHGYRNFANYRLRLLLHCGTDWNTPPVTPIRGRLPRWLRRATIVVSPASRCLGPWRAGALPLKAHAPIRSEPVLGSTANLPPKGTGSDWRRGRHGAAHPDSAAVVAAAQPGFDALIQSRRKETFRWTPRRTGRSGRSRAGPRDVTPRCGCPG